MMSKSFFIAFGIFITFIILIFYIVLGALYVKKKWREHYPYFNQMLVCKVFIFFPLPLLLFIKMLQIGVNYFGK